MHPQLLNRASAVFLMAIPAAATPLCVDINANGRADMRTERCENWQPSDDAMTSRFGDLAVTLRPGAGSSLATRGNKALVVRGVTLAADGLVATGGESATIELVIEGLTPGPHRFVGYHHALDDDPGGFAVSIGEDRVEGLTPSREVNHDDEAASSCIDFVAEEGKPVVVTIAADSGKDAWLSGFAIDLANPARTALKPHPADLERHADGDSGKVKLSWTPAAGVVSHRVHLATATTPAEARRLLGEAGDSTLAGTPGGSSLEVPVEENNSLLHHAWRVDSVDANGEVTRGDTWTFRVRHPAFPGAEGWGRFAIGGRGGRVIHVTNLDDSGPGSLREAVEATGPRTVVFDVSGLISLKSRLIFKDENAFLTVAGQTAPGKGICLRNHTFGGIGGKDTIVRFVRMRLGNLEGGRDGMGLAASDHCIFDHCSISWTIDEAFSSRQAKNITLQRCLISEALNPTGHGFAGSIGGDVGSFHHNLLAHNAGRNWSLAGSADQANRHAGRLDIRNMVVYNWGHRTTDGGAREVNFVNNYYKPGPASEVKTYLNPQFEHPHFGPQQYYVAGNVMEGVCGPEGPEGPFKGVATQGSQEAPVTVPEPFFESHVTTHTAEEAYDNVLADVGCNVPVLDDHDQRIIREVREGTFTYKGSRNGLPGLPDHQDDVGGWEDYPEIRRPADWDSDRDGLPGKWERDKGLDPEDPSDGALDPDGDGYTHLEDYLNWLAAGNTLD